MRAHTLRLGVLGLFALSFVGGACHRREQWPGPKGEGAPGAQGMPAMPPEPVDALEGAIAPLKSGAHPRILLSRDRLDALEAVARTAHSSWADVMKSCNETVGGKAESGYEAEDWGNFTLDLALCARVTKRDDYANAALKYFSALLDDKEKVGDGGGGLRAVQANDGYSIRNRGFLAAIAYDWLYERIPNDVRKHAADRFHAFCNWYAKDGYKHDDPIANHYMSYFGACAMGGLALEGEDPRGAEMRKMARGMFEREIIPAYKKLGGGDFPEGWQYARIPGAAIGFFVDAESRATGKHLAETIPWLRESVAFQAHALFPDGTFCWDNADWSNKPARPFAEQLYAAAIALGDDSAGKRALFLARMAKRPNDPKWNWLQAIGDDPTKKGEDPRKGTPSYLAPGTGTMFARTDWTPDAIWVGMNASPAFGDHQHLDQGHFEVVRGTDRLIIDPGDYDSYSTMSHNTLLVDDAHENLRWSPNQGIWGKDVSITRFEEAGSYAYAEASFGAAYNPDGYPEDHPQRSVLRAERELVFARGGTGTARVVLYDRVTLTKPTYGVTWAAHASVAPQPGPEGARISIGKSSAIVTTLVPAGARPRFLAEPTLKSDEMFTKNDPAEGVPSTRMEVESPKGQTERRFLHVIAIGASGEKPAQAVLVPGEGAEGAAFGDEAYVFVSPGPQRLPAGFTYRAPVAAVRHVVTGLLPGARYAITSAANGAVCKVTVLPGGALGASPAGTIAMGVRGCAIAAAK